MNKFLSLRLQCICYDTVAKSFAEWHKHQKNDPIGLLTWEKLDFPFVAGVQCKKQVFLNTDPKISLRTQMRQQKQANKFGSDFAKSLLKEAGYI